MDINSLATNKVKVQNQKVEKEDKSTASIITNTVTVIDQKGPNTEGIAADVSENKTQASSKSNQGQEETGGMSKRALKKLKRFNQMKQTKKNAKTVGIEDRGFSKQLFSETNYYFENGLRKVYPYYYTFTTFVKERWQHRSLKDVFNKEFIAFNGETYLKHIENGKILVNEKQVPAEYMLRNGDRIAHTIHRHENPVADTDLEIIEDTDELLVINKPSSIPCHPCGKYRFNSIVFILGKEYGYANLRNIYRLDRLTSGLLMLGKNHSKTKQLEEEILKRQVQKEYVSRVVGKFPDGIVKVDEPLDCMRHNLTLWRVKKGGKESSTSFERLSYNGHSSVVKCMPHTGRTHQIRVHLQFLGFPIVNDTLYNCEAWGPNKGKGGIIETKEEDLASAILLQHNVGQFVLGENLLYQKKLSELETKKSDDICPKEDTESNIESSSLLANASNTHAKEEVSDEPPLKRTRLEDNLKVGFEEAKWNIDEGCDSCKQLYVDPPRKDQILYLHAYKYQGSNWAYEAPLPSWASSDWKEESE